MNIEAAILGRRVIAAEPLAGVPIGSEGVVVGNWPDAIMVAWDFPERPLPKCSLEAIAAMKHNAEGVPYRDVFPKASGLPMLIEADAPGYHVTTTNPQRTDP